MPPSTPTQLPEGFGFSYSEITDTDRGVELVNSLRQIEDVQEKELKPTHNELVNLLTADICVEDVVLNIRALRENAKELYTRHITLERWVLGSSIVRLSIGANCQTDKEINLVNNYNGGKHRKLDKVVGLIDPSKETLVIDNFEAPGQPDGLSGPYKIDDQKFIDMRSAVQPLPKQKHGWQSRTSLFRTDLSESPAPTDQHQRITAAMPWMVALALYRAAYNGPGDLGTLPFAEKMQRYVPTPGEIPEWHKQAGYPSVEDTLKITSDMAKIMLEQTKEHTKIAQTAVVVVENGARIRPASIQRYYG